MSNLLRRLDSLRELARRFRAALENCDQTKLPVGLQAFPSGACADASLLLAKYLQEKGEGKAEYVSGNDGNQTHAWLELDGIIIDITADQFNRSIDPVIVSTNSTWHQSFEDRSRRTVSIDDYDAHTSTSLNLAYQELIHTLEKAQ
jgi:hypothetical protein